MPLAVIARGRASLREGHRERYGLLLLALLAAFAIQGIAQPAAWEQIVVSVLLAATLLLALWAAEVKPAIIRAGFVVGVVVVISTVLEAAEGNIEGAAPRLANLLLVTVAPVAVVIGVVRSLRARGRVTVPAVFGVLCLYLLVGMFFALVYGAIAQIDGTFFANGDKATVARCLYFSFTTLTTTGYGDFTAASNLGHTLSVTEALIGQIYLVTIVSLIVSNLRRPEPGADQGQR